MWDSRSSGSNMFQRRSGGEWTTKFVTRRAQTQSHQLHFPLRLAEPGWTIAFRVGEPMVEAVLGKIQRLAVSDLLGYAAAIKCQHDMFDQIHIAYIVSFGVRFRWDWFACAKMQDAIRIVQGIKGNGVLKTKGIKRSEITSRRSDPYLGFWAIYHHKLTVTSWIFVVRAWHEAQTTPQSPQLVDENIIKLMTCVCSQYGPNDYLRLSADFPCRPPRHFNVWSECYRRHWYGIGCSPCEAVQRLSHKPLQHLT